MKQLDRMERIPPPEELAAGIHFKFPQPGRSGQRVMALKDVDQAYGDKRVYSDLNFEIERDARIVLVGPNGAGKSTLLKILADAIPIQGGERVVGHNVKVGYYAQYRVEMLDESRTVLEEARAGATGGSEEFTRTVLGAFLFSGESVFKPVGVPSGGEKSRLALVKLLLDPPNLLLMDEPTTHLDIPSIDALIGALKQFEGTLVFISHDVYFIRSIAQNVLHVQAGQITPYAGDYQYFLDKTAATSERGALVSADPKLTNAQPQDAAVAAPKRERVFKTKQQKRAEAEARQAKSRARKDVLESVRKLEQEVFRLEAEEKSLAAKLEDPATYDDPSLAMNLNREMMAVAENLGRTTAEWEAAAEKLAALENEDPVAA